MKEAIDIYVKLLIAIVSFIAPLIIHLLSVFSDGIAVVRRKFNEEETQMAKLIRDEINSQDVNVANLISNSNASFKTKKEKNKCQLQLLDPKRQIIRIFPTLFLSICFMVAFSFVMAERDDLITQGKVTNRYDIALILLFLGSAITSFLGVLFLKQVAWAVIEVKQEIAEDKEKRSPKNGLTRVV